MQRFPCSSKSLFWDAPGGLQIEAKSKYDKAKKLFEEAQKELENNETKLKNVEDQMARYFARTSTAITEGKTCLL